MKRARSEEAKDERRAQLLEAALSEVFEKGFSAARMDDVARRAKLSKGTLYLYFDSKTSMFRELIDELAVPKIEGIEQIAQSAPSIEDALDRFAILAPILVRESKLPMLMKILIGDSQTFPDILTDYRQNVLERILAALTSLLEREAARGAIAIGDPLLTARLIVAPAALSGIWHALFGQEKGLEIDLEALFRMHAENMKIALKQGVTS